MRIAAIAVLALLCLPVWAQPSPEPTLDVTLQWTAPVQNTDGSPLTDLAGYRIYYGTVSGQYTGVISVMDAGATQYVVTGETLAENTTYFFAATAVNAEGLESAYSVETSGTTPDIPEVPNPPANLTVQAGAQTAYTLQISSDSLALVPSGTVPAGTACGPQSVRDRNGVFAYMVPASAVQWAGSVRSGAAFAQCSTG